MGYVAVRGGEAAITEAIRTLELLRTAGAADPLGVDQIRDQLRLLVDRVMAEGGLHDPQLAALAVKQAFGDPLEASFILRAHRSHLPRLGETAAHRGDGLRVVRRISSAFKEIPGGQVLGPSTDYLQRLFRRELIDESPEAFKAVVKGWFQDLPEDAVPATFPKVLDLLRAEGLLDDQPAGSEAVDITRSTLAFPIPRPARLAHMARGETGGLLAIAYSTMRGYGYLHPTVAELRVGWLPVMLPHPLTGEPVEAGEVLITECEIIATHEAHQGSDGPPRLSLGYGACFGHQETKAIAMAMCDRAMVSGEQRGARHPAEDAEFVVCHIDGIEAMGFCSHYKLPHYVTFQSDLENLRTSRAKMQAGAGERQP
jgi:alpha-D-ribose 1-methylphosphonate 5-triphosphate synthase subunit PhnI